MSTSREADAWFAPQIQAFGDKMRCATMELHEKMNESLGGFGGILRCETCYRTEPLGNPSTRVMGGGWPKCCNGHTMRWWTQRQIDAGEMPPRG